MPPKNTKQDKDKRKSKIENSSSGNNLHQNVTFTFTLEVQQIEIQNIMIMIQWAGSKKRIDTPSIEQYQKQENKDNWVSYIHVEENVLVDDEFCRQITESEFFIYFVNTETSIILQEMRLDFSSLLSPNQKSENPFFVYEESKMKIIEIEYFKFTLMADKQLITPLYKQYLNPIEIEIIGAKNVPISIEDHCPVYVSYQFFGFSKQFQTRGKIHSQKIKWGHKHVFLAGLWDQQKLIESIKSKQIKMELHDADVEINDNIRETVSLIDLDKILKENKEEVEEQEQDQKNQKNAKKPGKQPPPAQKEEKKPKKDAKKPGKTEIKNIEPVQPEKAQLKVQKTNFGVATFSLIDLLKPNIQNNFKLLAPVVPVNENDDGDIQKKDLDLNTTAKKKEKGIVNSVNYFDNDSFLVIGISLCYKLNSFDISQVPEGMKESFVNQKAIENKEQELKSIKEPIFERIIIVTEYKVPEYVPKIYENFYKINMKAFNFQLGGQKAISTKLLTEEEKQSKQIDYLTGFVLMDSQFRVHIFEGIGSKAIQNFYDQIKIADPNSHRIKILRNKEIKFTERIYTDFNIDIKRFKLANPIGDILIKPEIYIRDMQPVCVRNALVAIQEIRKADSLHTLTEFDLFPRVDGLIQLERRYCDYNLTQFDIFGYKPKDNLYAGVKAFTKIKKIASSMDSKAPEDLLATSKQFFIQNDQQKQISDQIIGDTTRLESNRLSLPNIQTGKITIPAKTRNFQSYNLHMKDRYEGVDEGEEVYLYGSQKNNIHQKQLEELREKIRSDKKYYYTYSLEYLSGSIDPYDLEMVKQEEKRKEKERLALKDKFDTIGKKSMFDRRQPRNQLPQSMVEWMQSQPFSEEQERKKKFKLCKGDFEVNESGKLFKLTVPNIDLFSVPERESLQSAVEAHKQKMEQLKQQRENFMKKMVVSSKSMVFQHGCMSKSNQLDKQKGVLIGNPQKKGLYLSKQKLSQYNQNLSRKVQDMPSSMFFNDPYQGDKSNIFIRKPDTSKFISQYQFQTEGINLLSQSGVYKPLNTQNSINQGV